MKLSLFSAAEKFGPGAAEKVLRGYEFLPRLVMRLTQLVFAAIVVGLYGTKVGRDHRDGEAQSVDWLYAMFVGGVSGVTCMVYLAVHWFREIRWHFAWDFTLVIFWLALGVRFHVIYQGHSSGDYDDASVRAMKAAIAFDFINTILWLLTGIYSCVRQYAEQKIVAMFEKVFSCFKRKAKGGAEKAARKVAGEHYDDLEMGFDKLNGHPLAQTAKEHIMPKVYERDPRKF
jgi:hypothetical protein